ncbi:MAG: DUF4145 domain-containing protein [Candidatus Eisenbacteria bacterium]|nr:DUF4145 domain-containing protein [Candidatus Eisenbacteria bacterium]
MVYIAPAFKLAAYNCPYCGAYSHIFWLQLHTGGYGSRQTPVYSAKCTHCDRFTYWIADEVAPDTAPTSGRMIEPRAVQAPMPHPEMPEDVLADYQEARSISGDSPRGAAALVRLSIQKLCVHLGEKGENIDQDIAHMVAKDLPTEIQQALDIVRVVGNNAVHPGEISQDDVAEVASTLFQLVNQIVEERISRPKRIRGLFESLPERARDHIEKRDGKHK